MAVLQDKFFTNFFIRHFRTFGTHYGRNKPIKNSVPYTGFDPVASASLA